MGGYKAATAIHWSGRVYAPGDPVERPEGGEALAQFRALVADGSVAGSEPAKPRPKRPEPPKGGGQPQGGKDGGAGGKPPQQPQKPPKGGKG